MGGDQGFPERLTVSEWAYLFGKEAVREREFRVKLPHGQTCDDSEYSSSVLA